MARYAFLTSPPGVDGLSLLLVWIAERGRYTDIGRKRYDRLYKQSVGPEYEKVITQHTRYLANQVCDNHIQEVMLQFITFS